MSDINNQLLILVVPNQIRDDLIDSLSIMTELSGFNLNKINGYSREHSHFNLNEQVEGYREFWRFEIMHRIEDTALIMQNLAPTCKSANVRYWQIPLLASGTFQDIETE